MGSFCKPTYENFPTSSETVEGTEIPAWVAAAGRGLFQNAANIANQPYDAYSGIQQASYDDQGNITRGGNPLSLDERRGGDILRDGASSYQPFYDKAGNIADTLGGGYDSMTREELLGDQFQIGDSFNLEGAQPFMDIYQSAMDPAVREIEEQTIRAQNEARARASTGGGGFGSRLGIMEATTAGEGAQAAGDLRAGAAREGLDFAAGRYDTDRAARASTENTLRGQFDSDRAARFNTEDTMRGQFDTDRAARFSADTQGRDTYSTNEASRIQQMDAYQGMAPLVQDLQTQAAAGLIGAGEARRQLDQNALDLAYADYLDQRLYPQEQINFALGALSGTPYNTINRSYTSGSQMSANPSLFGQALAGMGGLYSAYKMANG